MRMKNRKPCMKCGGMMHKMQTGGTPPNCEPGYIVDPKDPTKCIPIPNLYGITVPKIKLPTVGTTTTMAPMTTTASGEMENTQAPKGVNIWQPSWVNPLNPSEQKPIPFDSSIVSGTGFNPFAQKMDEKQTVPEEKIDIEKYVLDNEKENEKCEPGFIFDTISKKCVRDRIIPPNFWLEGANTLLNLISKQVAEDRDNKYINQQLQSMIRQPAPYWSYNEQREVPAYNPYVEKGGIINFKRYKRGGSTNNKTNNMIKIKEENKGKFTAQARRAGMGVQEFADYVLGNPDRFTASTVKRANFAKNAAGWKKAFGGMTENNPYYSYYGDDNYQDGGGMPMQDGQQPMMEGEGQGGGDQMQQIIMMIVEALQEGMSPQDILAALVKMGIPQDQATQLLQAVIEQMQGGGGQPMQGQEMEEGNEQEGQQAAPMMGYGGKAMPRNEGFQALPQYVQEKIMRNMQGGGKMKDEMNMTIKAYAQMKRISPEEVMQMIQQQLQSVSPQQQDQALQSIMQNMQMEIKQAQEGAQAGQMQQEQGMMRMGGMNSNYYNR